VGRLVNFFDGFIIDRFDMMREYLMRGNFYFILILIILCLFLVDKDILSQFIDLSSRPHCMIGYSLESSSHDGAERCGFLGSHRTSIRRMLGWCCLSHSSQMQVCQSRW
jgi:hypothetical protein